MSTYIKTLTEGNNTIAPRTTASAVTMDDNTTLQTKLTAVEAEALAAQATAQAKYTKPASGIPKTDLAASVQTSLGKADTAIQDISGKQDVISDLSTIRSGAASGATSVQDVQVNNSSVVQNHIAKIVLETGLGSDSNNSATVTAIRAFVNSSINSLAAYYITSSVSGDAFATKAALDAGPWYYSGSLRTPTRLDYAIVIADETHDGKSARYAYTENQWAFQYTFQMTFTQAQVNAINSGITAAKVQIYDNHIASTSNPHSVTKSQVGLGNVDNTSDATKKSNFTGSIASGNTGFITGGTAYTALAGKESTSNKVSAWSATTTDTNYPSEKLVKDSLDAKSSVTANPVTTTANLTGVTIDGTSYKIAAGLPDGTAAGNALVFDGTNWTQQDGYGYTSGGGGGGGSTIWNGDITGKVCLMDQFYLVDTSIAASASAYIGGTVTVHTNEGDQEFQITSVLTEEGITLLMHANDMYFSAVLMEPTTIEETTYPAGLYFMYMDDEGDIFYASKLVYGSAPVVHQINSKYLSSYRTSSAQDVIDATKLTDAPSDNKQYARKNGAWAEVQGGGSAEGAVRYDEAQTLTDAQKLQARTNIGQVAIDNALQTAVQPNINQWDEMWEVGGYDLNTGAKVASNRIRSANKINIQPNTTYYFKTASIYKASICYYDSNDNFISSINLDNTNILFATPSGAYKMAFHIGTGYGTTYNHDISINYPSSFTLYYPSALRKTNAQIGALGDVIGMRGWNQLVPTTSETSTFFGVTITSNGDGSFTLNGTSSNTAVIVLISNLPINGHKVYVKGNVSQLVSNCGIMLQIIGSGAEYREIGSDNGFILQCESTGEYKFGYYITSGSTLSNVVIKPVLIDLTAMGLGYINSVADFRAMFPADYYPYCSGSFADLLWTNASPTSSFSTQTINIDLTSYNYLFIVFKRGTENTDDIISFLGVVGETLDTQSLSLKSNKLVWRGFRATNSGIIFSSGLIANTYGSWGTDDSVMIPYKIYGIR